MMNITSAKWVCDPTTNQNCAVYLDIEGERWCAPLRPGNRFYDAFQEWLAEGNTPLPADKAQ
jgi:hypothetical protein